MESDPTIDHARRTRLTTIATTLDEWRSDADTAIATWGSKTAAQKEAAYKLTIERLGKLCSGLADLLRHQGIAE